MPPPKAPHCPIKIDLHSGVAARSYNTFLSNPDMTVPSDETRQRLREACHVGDALYVSQLFVNQPFTADDATDALKDTHLNLDPALIRILLQNGANANLLQVRKIPKSKFATELLRLLAEYRYDFKPDGHRILQSVFSPSY
jgi:hypothetical protein